MSNAWLAAVVLTASAATHACGYSCTADARGGIGIALVDATTGAPICEAEIIASDGRTTERLRLQPFQCSFGGLMEQPGEYEISIKSAGYLDAHLSSVEIHHDGCHVIGVSRNVSLMPDPNAPPRDAGTD